MEKQKAVYPNSGILFSHKKRMKCNTCYGMKLQNIMPSERGQKLDKKGHVLYDSIYMK